MIDYDSFASNMVSVNEIAKIDSYNSVFDKLAKRSKYENVLYPRQVPLGVERAFLQDKLTTMTADDYEPPVSIPTGGTGDGTVEMVDAQIFEIGDTVIVQGVLDYERGGTTLSNKNLMCTVLNINGNDVTLHAVYGKKIGQHEHCLPDIPAGATVVIIARNNKNSETDIILGAAEQNNNFCQEFSYGFTVDKNELASYEKNERNLAILARYAKDMLRITRDMSFVFSRRDGSQSDLACCNGIFEQTDKEFKYTEIIDNNSFMELMRETTECGNNRTHYYALVGGCKLIAMFANLDYTRTIFSSESKTKLGVEPAEFRSPFCQIKPYHSQVFDYMYNETSGILFPIDDLIKYEYAPLTEKWAIDNNGNTTYTISEISCLTLKHPERAIKIIQM